MSQTITSKGPSLSDLQRDDDSSVLTEASLFENLARRGEARRPAPSATTTTLSPQPADVVAAIFTGRRGVGNAVCRNFLFPLGWPACGVNSTLPLSRDEKGAQLRCSFSLALRDALEVGQGERQRPVVVIIAVAWETVHIQPRLFLPLCQIK